MELCPFVVCHLTFSRVLSSLSLCVCVCVCVCVLRSFTLVEHNYGGVSQVAWSTLLPNGHKHIVECLENWYQLPCTVLREFRFLPEFCHCLFVYFFRDLDFISTRRQVKVIKDGFVFLLVFS